MWWGAQALSANRHFLSASGVFSQQYWVHQRDKVQKARKPTHFGTWRQGSWLKLWPHMPVRKCQPCYYMSRNSFWKKTLSAFISEGTHLKDCTHFCAFNSTSDYKHAKKYLILSPTEQFCWFIVSFKTDDSCKQSKTSLKALNAQKFTYVFFYGASLSDSSLLVSHSDPWLQSPLGSCSEFYYLIVLTFLRG